MSEQATGPTPAALHEGKVGWSEWGPAAFARARDEDKLLLVDVGAVWCHWCHVMDRTTYDHGPVASIINERFVPVRVDRDQRPDIDSRLQRAVPMIQSQGNGWPLTVFLTPAGHVLYKATYVPPTADNRFGTGFGMLDLLEQVEKLYRQRQAEFDRAGPRVADELASAARDSANQPGQVSDEAVGKVLRGIGMQFDPSFGGFGSGGGPKFPHCSAVDLLLVRTARDGDASLRAMALQTLGSMAHGGIHDHLAGGFHRYSVDPYWRVPHFEKMAYDNAALLGNYARAFTLSGDESCRRVARGILRFTREVLYDPDGGFGASQDADIGLDDDGDYFTWTLAEVESILTGPERDAVVSYFNVAERGDMHEAPDRNVLNASKTVEQLARLMGADEAELAGRIESGKARLLAERATRPTPWIDRTIFADLNGMYIRGCAVAAKLLGDDEALSLATRAADRVLADCLRDDGQLAHYVLGGGPRAHGSTECRVFGLLADHAHLARGLLGLYTSGAGAGYLAQAVRLLEHVVERLQDREHGGFVDGAAPADDAAILQTPAKSWEDSPTLSANAAACLALLEAGELAGREEFTDAARRAVESFAGAIQPQLGLFVAGWGLAADMLLHPPPHVVVIGSGEEAGRLLDAAWQSTLGCALTEKLDPGDSADAARIASAGYPSSAGAKACAFACRAGTCWPPVQTPGELLAQLQSA